MEPPSKPVGHIHHSRHADHTVINPQVTDPHTNLSGTLTKPPIVRPHSVECVLSAKKRGTKIQFAWRRSLGLVFGSRNAAIGSEFSKFFAQPPIHTPQSIR
jgi:hypothetical protein